MASLLGSVKKYLKAQPDGASTEQVLQALKLPEDSEKAEDHIQALQDAMMDLLYSGEASYDGKVLKVVTT